jgi:hypothetical protein
MNGHEGNEGMSHSPEEFQRIALELDLCQEHLGSSYMRSWQSGAIILAGAMAALALMLRIESGQLAAAVISTPFAVGVVWILHSWRDYLRRERAFQRLSIWHMRELEGRIGLRRQLYIQLADDWNTRSELWKQAWKHLTPEEQHRFEGRYIGEPGAALTRLGAHSFLGNTSLVVQVGWVLVAAWRWLIYAGLLD